MAETKSARRDDEWTLGTLKEHFTAELSALEKRFKDLSDEREEMTKERFTSSKEAVAAALAAAKEAVAAAMAAAEKAILKAEAAADKRAEASNEIREAMIDQQKTFASREETGLKFTAIEQRQTEAMTAFDKRLDVIADVLKGQAGKADAFAKMATVVIAVAAVAVSLFAIFFHH